MEAELFLGFAYSRKLEARGAAIHRKAGMERLVDTCETYD